MVTIKKKIEQELTIEVAECPYCFMNSTQSNKKVEPKLNLEQWTGGYCISCANCCANGPSDKDYTIAVEKWNKIAMIVKSYMRY